MSPTDVSNTAQPATPAPAPATPQAIDVDFLVKTYVTLRDLKKSLEDQAKAQWKPYNERFEKIEAILLKHLDDQKVESIRAASGTVFKGSRKSATIGDAEAFRNFVISQREWDVADWKANATATSDFLAEHGTLPPGVNYRVDVTLNVRRGDKDAK